MHLLPEGEHGIQAQFDGSSIGATGKIDSEFRRGYGSVPLEQDDKPLLPSYIIALKSLPSAFQYFR